MQAIASGAGVIFLGNGYFSGSTSGNKVHTYNLEFYFSDSGDNQNTDQGKELQAYIKIGAGSKLPGLTETILTDYGEVETIEAKATPSFSVTTPQISNYIEVTTENNNVLISNNNKTIGSGYSFSSSNGYYSLQSRQTSKSYGIEYIGWYTCDSTSYSSCSTMYKIVAVDGTSIVTSTKYTSEAVLDYDDTGVFAAEDDYGDSYYFRGDRNYLKNNIIFADLQWKIVRINGNGSIRIIYNGTCVDNSCTINSTGTATQIGTARFNSMNDNKYLGFMYGGLDGVASTSREQATSNETSSIMKTYLDTWYENNILNTEYEDYISDTLFCNDRQLQSEVGGAATGTGNK